MVEFLGSVSTPDKDEGASRIWRSISKDKENWSVAEVSLRSNDRSQSSRGNSDFQSQKIRVVTLMSYEEKVSTVTIVHISSEELERVPYLAARYLGNSTPSSIHQPDICHCQIASPLGTSVHGEYVLVSIYR